MSRIPSSLRQEVISRSGQHCSYCQSQQRIMGAALTIDHIIPESFGGTTTLDNLCLACWECNLIKGVRITANDPRNGVSVRIFHPNKQSWQDHFRWSDDGLYIIGQTPTGRATVAALRLNRPQLVRAREFWTLVGWHPPFFSP